VNDATKQLIHQLQASNPALRKQAAQQLGELRAFQAVAPLIVCLRDQRYRVQVAAAQALGSIGDAAAVPALILMFDGQTYGLIEEDGAPGRYFAILESAAHALAQIGSPPAIERLLAQLHQDVHIHRDETVAAAVALGYAHHPEAFPILLKGLASPSYFVRYYAAQALGEFGSRDAVEPLIQILYDPVYTVQIAAAQALGTLHDGRAAVPLRAAFTRSSTIILKSRVPAQFYREMRMSFQAKAARGLGLLGDAQSLSLLEQFFRSTQWERQAMAAIGLGYQRDPRAFAILTAVLTSDLHGILADAAGALGQLGGKQAISLIRATAKRQDVPSSYLYPVGAVLEQLEKGTRSDQRD
jgi:HEAT repeat protein